MSYDRSAQNYMRVSELRSSQASSIFGFFRKDPYWGMLKDVEKINAPKRLKFQAWHTSLPPTEYK